MERDQKMEYLVNYFNSDEILHLINVNSNIKELEPEEVELVVNLFKQIGIDEKSIYEIVYANPFCLNRDVTDIKKLIKKLYELGIEDMATIFEANPWFIDKDDFEIDDYIQEKLDKGKTMESIIDDISMGII